MLCHVTNIPTVVDGVFPELQAVKVLMEMQQRKGFTALLAVSLAETSKLNDKARADQLRSLDLSMHIAAGTIPQACALAHQVHSLPLSVSKWLTSTT